MADFAGLSKTQPKLAAALAIFMFSLAGIPPLLGFWPKFAVFQAAIASGLIALALIGFVALRHRRLLLSSPHQDHVFR